MSVSLSLCRGTVHHRDTRGPSCSQILATRGIYQGCSLSACGSSVVLAQAIEQTLATSRVRIENGAEFQLNLVVKSNELGMMSKHQKPSFVSVASTPFLCDLLCVFSHPSIVMLTSCTSEVMLKHCQ